MIQKLPVVSLSLYATCTAAVDFPGAQSCTEHHKPCRREKVPLGITLMGELSRGNGFSKCIYISTYHSSKWLDVGEDSHQFDAPVAYT